MCSEIAKDWHPTKNNNLLPDDVSWGSGKKVWWKCQNCGYEWETTIYSRTKGKGCPKCSSPKGEKRIFDFLNEKNISYISQYRFDDCKNKKPLPFDFYLTNHDILIEYQGIQHYKEVNNSFFGDEIKLKDRQRLDKIKSDYCKNNGINLLVIPYWDYDNIETILTERLIK